MPADEQGDPFGLVDSLFPDWLGGSLAGKQPLAGYRLWVPAVGVQAGAVGPARRRRAALAGPGRGCSSRRGTVTGTAAA